MTSLSHRRLPDAPAALFGSRYAAVALEGMSSPQLPPAAQSDGLAARGRTHELRDHGCSQVTQREEACEVSSLAMVSASVTGKNAWSVPSLGKGACDGQRRERERQEEGWKAVGHAWRWKRRRKTLRISAK